MKKRSLVIIIFTILIISVVLFVFIKKDKLFEGKIHYQITDSSFVIRQYESIVYDDEVVYEIKKDSIIEEFHRQNPAYLNLPKLVEKKIGYMPTGFNEPRGKLNTQIAIAGTKTVCDLKNSRKKMYQIYQKKYQKMYIKQKCLRTVLLQK